jgi:hypothetical protein
MADGKQTQALRVFFVGGMLSPVITAVLFRVIMVLLQGTFFPRRLGDRCRLV